MRLGPHPPLDSGFERGHRIARVLAIAVPLAMVLAWWGLSGHGKIKSVSETTAVVTHLDTRTCLVRIPTGQQVRILRAAGLSEGMTVRMKRIEYTDGTLRFELITAPLSSVP